MVSPYICLTRRSRARLPDEKGTEIMNEAMQPPHSGALSNLGHEIARSTIACNLERNGIEPAPERVRKTTWKEFLTRHWRLIAAADFFTVEVWTKRGLQRFIVLFFIDLSTRKVQIAGIASNANGSVMDSQARES